MEDMPTTQWLRIYKVYSATLEVFILYRAVMYMYTYLHSVKISYHGLG